MNRHALPTALLMSAVAVDATVPGSATAGKLCYDRVYDSRHLASHPDQLVTRMMLSLDPDGPAARGNRNSEAGRIAYDFMIAMKRRGDRHLLVQQGYILESHGLSIGVVECDGGGFRLQKDPSGALLSIGLGPSSGDRIRMDVLPDPCGESGHAENTVDVVAGADDRTFRLREVPGGACSAVFDPIDWTAAQKRSERE